MGIGAKVQGGMSMVELLFALSLLMMTLLVAIPGFAALRERNLVAAVNNELMASLALARSEAVRQRVETVVCPMVEAGAGCRSDGAWHNGWVVFVDPNRNGRLDDGEPVLIERGPLDGLTLSSGRGRPRVRYASNGMSRGSNLSIRLCMDGKPRSAIVANNAGRARLERDNTALAGMKCG